MRQVVAILDKQVIHSYPSMEVATALFHKMNPDQRLTSVLNNKMVEFSASEVILAELK